MKKALIILGSLIAFCIGITYLGFLFVLPNAINLDKYKPEVQKLLSEQAPLKIDFKNARIITTPLLSIGLKAEDISVKFDDNSELFFADSAKFKLALPSLLALTVKLPKIEVNNPKVNLAIVDGKQFKILTFVEQILASEEEKIGETEAIVEEDAPFILSLIRIKVPNITLNNYNVLVLDEKTGHKLTLNGEKLKLGYFNGKVVKIKTNANIFSDNNKNITANIDIDSFIPEPIKLDEEDDKPERVELPFINPVLEYQKYDLKSKLNAKMKLREKDGQIKAYGYFNVDNTTLKLSDYNLPECYFHGKFRGTRADIDTDISVAKNQNLKLAGMLDYGKHPKTEMQINCNKIYFNDLITLAKAALNSFHIKNSIEYISGKGYFEANAKIKTNLKKLESQGKILVKDGAIINKNINLGITNTNINLLFDNNTLDIQNSSMLINNAPLKFDGKIDENSVADIKIYANKIPLKGLFLAFAPNELKNSINLNNGNISINANLQGQLKKALCDLKMSIENFAMSDKSNSLRVTNKDLQIQLKTNEKESLLTLANNGLSVIFPYLNSTVKNDSLKIEISGDETKINPAFININSNSKIKFEGLINSSKANSSLKITGDGTLDALDLKRFAGNQAAPFIDAKGQIPLNIDIDGNNKRQNLSVRLFANSNNYISPVKLTQTANLDTVLQAKINFKENRLKIKDTGLFTISKTTDEKGNTTEQLNEIAGVNGTIADLNSEPFINIVRITLPQGLSGSICGFRNSGFDVNGKLFVFGKSQAPRMRGKFVVNNFFIRDLLTTLESLTLDFRGKTLNVNAKNLNLNGSDISAQTDISLEPAKITSIYNLKVNSENLDLDKLMLVSTAASRKFPADSSSSKNSTPASIPVELRNGTINFKNIKTGDIKVKNTVANVALFRNIFYVNNLHTNVFDGNVRGRISMNLLNNLLKINLYGDNLDTNKLLIDATGMKDTLSGKMSFKTDLSLDAGAANYNAQMKSLAGGIDFSVKNGQFGPFGKLENMIIAENIRESQFFETALGGIVSGLTSIDTTHFEELNGKLNFKNGIVYIDPISSKGNVLTLCIAGNFNLLENIADMNVRGRLASVVSNVLGPIANVNPVNLVKVTPGLNIASAKLFSLFTQVVSADELKKIPEFKTKTDNFNATNFQIIVNGDVAKPLKLVKSFKWLALQQQVDSAQEFVATLPDPESLTSTVEEMQELQKQEEKTSTKIKNIFFKKDKKMKEELMLQTQQKMEKLKENSMVDINSVEKSEEANKL